MASFTLPALINSRNSLNSKNSVQNKQMPLPPCYIFMTKPANEKDKQSPSDTPTERPNDNGGKSKVKPHDKQYHADEPHGGNIAKKHEREEQPVHSVKAVPKS
jgi:hypothetical protein